MVFKCSGPTDNKFFEYVAGRSDLSNADVTVYRLDPLVKSEDGKTLAKVPAAEFSREWLEAQHGYGLYSLYFNDGSDRAGYAEGYADLREPRLLAAMYKPETCKVPLHEIVDAKPNWGYIKQWRAVGMWRDEGEQMAETNALAGILAKMIEQGTGGAGAGSQTALLMQMIQAIGADHRQAVERLERMIERQAERWQTERMNMPPPQTGISPEQHAQAIANAEMRAELGLLRQQIQERQTNPQNTTLAEAERLLRQAQSISTKLSGPDNSSALREILPHVGPLVQTITRLLQPQQPVTIPMPTPPTAVNPQPAPAPTPAPAAAAANEDAALILRAIQMFNRGAGPESAAEMIVDGFDRQDLYDQLRAVGATGCITMLSQEKTQPDVAAAVADADFPAWLNTFLNHYQETPDAEQTDAEPAVTTEPAAQPAE